MILKMQLNRGWTRMDTDVRQSAFLGLLSANLRALRVSALKLCLPASLAAFLLTFSSYAAAPTPAQVEFFEKSIRPVLAAECYECHSTAKKKGGLALDTREGLLKGGESGPAIVPGQPDSSLLLQALRHTHPTLKMPKNGAKLDARILANFAEWIRQGAPDPRTGAATASTQPASSTWADTLAFRRQWWSFQALSKPAGPTPTNSAWSTTAIDRFLLAKMELHDLGPGPDAGPRTFIRRLTFALTGLPPSAEDIDAFVRDSQIGNRQSAIGNATDRLLASPHFAERWARHWLDLVRYAETHGSESDPEIPQMWRYRDYVIRAFAADVPADQLIREHIAGDLLPPAQTRWNKPDSLNESRLGTAHFRLVEHGFQPVDTLDDQVKAVDSQVDVLAKAFQGLTISCARCHDHKFDPISQRDYYALYGILAATRPAQVQLDAPELLNKNRSELLALKSQIKSALADSWRDAIPQLIAQLTRGSNADPQLGALNQRVAKLEADLAAIEAEARAKALATRAGDLQSPSTAPNTPAHLSPSLAGPSTPTPATSSAPSTANSSAGPAFATAVSSSTAKTPTSAPHRSAANSVRRPSKPGSRSPPSTNPEAACSPSRPATAAFSTQSSSARSRPGSGSTGATISFARAPSTA